MGHIILGAGGMHNLSILEHSFNDDLIGTIAYKTLQTRQEHINKVPYKTRTNHGSR